MSDGTGSDTEHLTLLGGGSLPAQQKLEVFAAKPGLEAVTLETAELISRCPLTNQPDIYRCKISYGPAAVALETKSLKLYLWSFQETEGLFAEDLVDKIAGDVWEATGALWVAVELIQNPRGGITTTVLATRGPATNAVTLVTGGPNP